MLEVRDVSVAFGDTVALKNFGLKMKEGEVMGVLGPSGCGKTTLLRVVAGLQPADSGDVLWGEESVLEVPPHRRGFGLMFQDFSLFPHRSVGGNVAFGLRMAGLPAERVAARVSEVLDWVGLEGYEERAVGPLSGGEQQRVALARSLAPAPRLLMLDEPVGSLDRTLRRRLVGELRELLRNLGVTAVYVTHDQEEAFSIADRVVVMRQGRVAQLGHPEEVWRRRSVRSNDPTGSSSMSRRGAGARERARATRCCSPPESGPTARSSYPSKPTQSSTSETRAATLSAGNPAIRRPKATFPPTLLCGKSEKS